MGRLSGVQKFLIYLTAFFLILDNGTIYTHLPGLTVVDVFVTFFPIVTFSMLALRSIKKFVSEAGFISLVVLDVYLISFLLISNSNEKVSLFTLILFNLLLVYYISYERSNSPYLLIAYRNIIVPIAAISLFFWVGGSLLQLIPPTGTVISTWGQASNNTLPVLSNYYWMYFEGDEMFFLGGWLKDNVSIFTERAFASYSFMIGLIYELFLEEKRSKWRILLLLIAIISTTSTTGVISAIMAFSLFSQQKIASKNYLKIFYVVLIPFLAVLVYYSVDHLLESRASMGHSTISRTNDFFNGISAWLNSPIYGYGFANHDMLAKLGTGYSNSIAQVLTQGGIMLAALYVFSFMRCFNRCLHYKDASLLYFLLSFLVFFSTTGIATRNTILYIMVFFCAGYYNRKKTLVNIRTKNKQTR